MVNASPEGVGAVLTQVNPNDENDRRVICCASRLLSATERKYSQCEKEALAAVWACERFWIYLFGQQFILATDNRAVQLIFGNAASRPPARIERWGLRLSQFDFTIEHQSGKTNVADYFSRQPVGTAPTRDTSEDESELEQFINMVVVSALPRAITKKELAVATETDEQLQLLRKFIIQPTGRLPKELAEFEHVIGEISEAQDGVMLRGSRVIIPSKLRGAIVTLAHRGHQGVVKTKALIRARVWFPGIDKRVERIAHCHLCQTVATKQTFEPLRASACPNGPWERVAGDFFGPLANGKFWFVNLCKYSKQVFVSDVASTSWFHVRPVLDELFSIFGAPLIYKSDNGAPFQSHSFAEYARELGFEHRKITPLWPRANGDVERFMRNLGKTIRGAEATGISRDQALRDFLRAYRETPHATTKISPNVRK